MAASYSSFLTSQFYSPVFNTALFDGPFRIYFSQSYESIGLKIYHMLHVENAQLWSRYKEWADVTKKNVFILIYPSEMDVRSAFGVRQESASGTGYQAASGTTGCSLQVQGWDEGLVVGIENLGDDKEGKKFEQLFAQLLVRLEDYFEKNISGITEIHQ